MYRQTVTIVGVGALGSHLAQFLRNEASLFVIDFDRVEAKNTLAQFHPKSALNKGKAVSLYSTMNFLWGVKLETATSKLAETNVEALLGRVFMWPENLTRKTDLVIDCLDNGEARRVVQDYVRKHNIPCLHGALAANGAFGRVIWDELFQIDDEDGVGAPTCEAGEHLPFIALTAAYLARAAQLFLNNAKRVGFSISPGGAVQV